MKRPLSIVTLHYAIPLFVLFYVVRLGTFLVISPLDIPFSATIYTFLGVINFLLFFLLGLLACFAWLSYRKLPRASTPGTSPTS